MADRASEAAARTPLEAEELIPYARPHLDEEDARAVLEVLQGDWLTTGPQVPAFEAALAARVGVSHAVAVGSGTAALHAAYFASGLGPGDSILTSPLSFIATASTALHLGAEVRFADVDPRTGNLDPDLAAAAVEPATRLLVPVDFAGHPADTDRLRALADARGLALVADASHSLGATRNGRAAGSLADASTTSFHPVKPITTGEGGAVLTDRADWAERAARFRNHGIVRDPTEQQAPEGPWYYEVHELGLNYRLPDFACALGLSQLRRLDTFLARRREIAARYTRELGSLATLELPEVEAGVEPGWHLYVVRVRDPARRGAFFERLHELGIGVQLHYPPIHLHPVFRERGHGPGDFPVAEDFSARSLSIPLFPALRDDEVERVVERIHRAAGELL